MDNYEYSELLKALGNKISNIASIIKPDEIKARLDEIASLESDPAFWSDVETSAKIGKEKSKISKILENFNEAKSALNDASELFELANAENDAQTINALFDDSKGLEDKVTSLEISMMLSGENDDKNAIITIHPGAGGTESNDWASMLYRMYLRFCEREGYKVETLDFQEGDEAGLKDVSFIVRGENAYGYLKAENGVHRLVRISPFDANARRHTSFTAVYLYPEHEDVEFDLDMADVRVDTYRSSGAGGQYINKTDSAVRMTHLPTGIMASCQTERSQIQNRETCYKMLKTMVAEHYRLEEEAKRDARMAEKKKVEWGSQIRSYVLQPYQLVKDLRTGVETSDTAGVLDGKIKPFINAYLLSTSEGQK